MSIIICKTCDKWIDQDFDAEHEEMCAEDNGVDQDDQSTWFADNDFLSEVHEASMPEFQQ